MVDAQDVVDCLQHEAVAGAEPLVGRLDAELVAIVGEALVEEVETLEMCAQGGVRLGSGVRADGLAVAGLGAGQRAVDAAILAVAAAVVSVGVAIEGGVDLVGLGGESVAVGPALSEPEPTRVSWMVWKPIDAADAFRAPKVTTAATTRDRIARLLRPSSRGRFAMRILLRLLLLP